MAFFDNFKLLNKKSGFVIRYKDDTLLTIKPQTLKAVVYDHLSKKMIEEITNLVPSTGKRKTNTLAIKLLNSYNQMRKEYYKNPRLKKLTVDGKEFRHFVAAAELLKTHKVEPRVFLKAQIDGLSFVNDGQGVFPKPQQLTTLQAEERLIAVIADTASKTSVEDIKRLELIRADKETELMENPRFVSRYRKLERGTATLQDAYFIYDCMLARKGRVTQMVTDYIEELENGN